MRVAPPSIAMILACAMATPAVALQAEDSMSAWKKASDTERTELLMKIFGKDNADSAKITACMNGTSAVPGHADLTIAEVAKACASMSDQPV